MPKGSIEEIKQIETEANKQIQQAQKDSESKVQQAEKQVLQQRKQVLTKAKQDVEKQKEETKNTTTIQVQKILFENKKIIKQIEQEASPNIDQAVEFIIKKITEED